MLTALKPDLFSIDNVMKHVDHMQRSFPYRKSGLGQDLAAANYIADQLRSFELDVDLEEFDAYDSDPGTAALAVVGEPDFAIKALACTHVESTPDEGFTGQLVDVGAGGLADYDDLNVNGKIVLAEVSYAPATPEKARIAALKGAAGIVLMNWGADNGTEIPSRGLKAVWGNPTPQTWNDIPRLFGVSISRKDGIALRERLTTDVVTLNVKVTACREWRKLTQPLAWLRAPDSALQKDQFLIVSGHLDSWDPGVTDNITGNSVMMEIARGLASQRSSLKRSVVFCFWNGHEVAEATGSACFVDKHWEQINRNAVAYFNIDSVGMKNTTEFQINSSPELHAFSRKVASECFSDALPVRIKNLRRVGDQSFFGVGVSAATGRHMYPQDVVRAQNGATLGWYNHTEFDTMDVMDEQILAADLRWCGQFVTEMVVDEVLPHRLSDRLKDQQSRFSEALDGCNDPADFWRIPQALNRLAPLLAWLDDYIDKLTSHSNSNEPTAVNKLILRLSRLLTFVTDTACGKYGQDSYGISTLLQPVPRLADLQRYQELEEESLEARLLKTELIRRRHEISDALDAAFDLLVDFQSYHGTPA